MKEIVAKRIEINAVVRSGKVTKVVWTNGAGYTEEELERDIRKLEGDNRVVDYKIIR